MIDFMAQLFPFIPIALITTMVVFLLGKDRVNAIALYITVVVLCLGFISACALIDSAGFGAIILILYYLIPTIIMINFTLYTTVFNCITGDLKGKLKNWTAISLILFGMFWQIAVIDSEIFILMESFFEFMGVDSGVGILFGAFAVLYAAIILVMMFICAIQSTRKQRAKRFWVIFTFFLPFVGSIIYLIVHFVVWLVKVLIKTKTD